MMENRAVHTRNHTIDVFRYICAIMVVAIHTQPTADSLGYLIIRSIERISVPYFLAVAGYFYTRKLENAQCSFIPYFKKLFWTYCIWSFPYFILEYLSWGHSNLKGFFVNCVYTFFLNGSYYHFWFFIALFFAVCCVTFLFKIKKEKLLIPLSIILYVGVHFITASDATSNLNLGSFTLPLQSFLSYVSNAALGLFYFTCGYVVLKLQKQHFCHSPVSSLLATWIAFIVFWIIFICIDSLFSLNADLLIVFGLYCVTGITLLFLLQNPFPFRDATASKCKAIANFTYYSHPLFIFVINNTLPNGESLHGLLLFILTLFLTGTIGLLIYKINNPLLNKLIQ